MLNAAPTSGTQPFLSQASEVNPALPSAGLVQSNTYTAASNRMILVVDDEEAVRNVAARLLRASGFHAITAVDGFDGLEQLRINTDEIAAVILDLTMPRLNGEETLRLMDELKPGIKVLLMSGYSDQATITHLTKRSRTGFLPKPFGLVDLQNSLRQMLDLK